QTLLWGVTQGLCPKAAQSPVGCQECPQRFVKGMKWVAELLVATSLWQKCRIGHKSSRKVLAFRRNVSHTCPSTIVYLQFQYPQAVRERTVLLPPLEGKYTQHA